MVTQGPARTFSRKPGAEGSVIRVQRSFGGNMAKMLLSHPDVFLFTHKSAIPLADSVRGYYEEIGVKVPEFGVVNTKDEDGASEEYTRGTWNWEQSARHYDFDSVRRDVVVVREVRKLTDLLQGRSVAIIDQMISEGVTIRTAMDIADEAGAVIVSRPEDAKWYNDAREKDIDFQALSSTHKEFLTRVGRSAAQVDVTTSA